jgi:DNA polymerase elongation subunit (family B)
MTTRVRRARADEPVDPLHVKTVVAEYRHKLRALLAKRDGRLEEAAAGLHIKSTHYPDSFARFLAHEAKHGRPVERKCMGPLPSNLTPVETALRDEGMTRDELREPSDPFELMNFSKPEDKKEVKKEEKKKDDDPGVRWFASLRGAKHDCPAGTRLAMPPALLTRDAAWTWRQNEAKRATVPSTHSAPSAPATIPFRLLQVLEFDQRLWLQGVTDPGYSLAVELLDFRPFFFVVPAPHKSSSYRTQFANRGALPPDKLVAEVRNAVQSFLDASPPSFSSSTQGQGQTQAAHDVDARAELWSGEACIRLSFSSWRALTLTRQALALRTLTGLPLPLDMRMEDLPQRLMFFCAHDTAPLRDFALPAGDETQWVRPDAFAQLEQELAAMDAEGDRFTPTGISPNPDDGQGGDPAKRTPRMAFHLVGRLRVSQLTILPATARPFRAGPSGPPITQAVFDIETVAGRSVEHQRKYRHRLPWPSGEKGERYQPQPGEGPAVPFYSPHENPRVRARVEAEIAAAKKLFYAAHAPSATSASSSSSSSASSSSAPSSSSSLALHKRPREVKDRPAQTTQPAQTAPADAPPPAPSRSAPPASFEDTEAYLLPRGRSLADMRRARAALGTRETPSLIDPRTKMPFIHRAFPNPRNAGDGVIIIATHLLRLGESAPYARVLHVLDDGTTPVADTDFPNTWLLRFRREEDLLDHWTRMLWAWDLFWLTGFNSITYDLPFLARRLMHHRMRSGMRRLGRIYEWPWDHRAPSAFAHARRPPPSASASSSSAAADAASAAKRREMAVAHLPKLVRMGKKYVLQTPGLVQFDIYVLVKSMYLALDEYNLKFLARYFGLPVHKLDVPGDLISPYYAAGGAYRRLLWKYCERDVEVTWQLQVKKAPAGNLIEIAKLAATTIEQQMMQGQGQKVYNMLMVFAYRNRVLYSHDRRLTFQALAKNSLAQDPLPPYLGDSVWRDMIRDDPSGSAARQLLPDLYARKLEHAEREADGSAGDDAMPIEADWAEEGGGDDDADGDGDGDSDDEPDESPVEGHEERIEQEAERIGTGLDKPKSASAAKRDKCYQGAIVQSPTPGFFGRRIVVTVDFSSLYPNLIRSRCLCPTTVRRVRYAYIGGFRCSCHKSRTWPLKPGQSPCACFDPAKVTPWFPEYEDAPDRDDWTPAFDKYYLWDPAHPKPDPKLVGDRDLLCLVEVPAEGKFPARSFAFVQNRGSLVPHCLTELLALRKSVQKQMKTFRPDDPEYAVLDAQQAAVKVLCNAMYGVLGAKFGKVGCMPVAMCITACGRIDITETRRVAEQVYGFECIYGDTDSLFLLFPGVFESADGRMLAFVSRLATAYCEEMSRQRLPAPMNLEYEKAIGRFTLFQKKKYYGIYMNTDKAGKPIGKGLEHVRRDFCKLSRDALAAVLKGFLDPRALRDPERLLAPATSALRQILAHDAGPDMFQRTVSKKDGINPKTPQAEVFRLLQAEGNHVEEGTRVPFVFVMPKGRAELIKDEKAYKLARPVDWVLRDPSLRVNREYYVRGQLRDPLARMLQFQPEALRHMMRLCDAARAVVWRQDAGVPTLPELWGLAEPTRGSLPKAAPVQTKGGGAGSRDGEGPQVKKQAKQQSLLAMFRTRTTGHPAHL